MGRDLWEADDGWTHTAGQWEAPTPPDAPHPTTGSLWRVSDVARETGAVTALELRPATLAELPQLRERADWDRRRHASCVTCNAVQEPDGHPAKVAALAAHRAIENEHLDWLPQWHRDALMQSDAKRGAP